MALRVWLPLNGSLENKGLSSTDFGTSTAFASTGKIGAQSAYSNMQKTITCPELTGITEFSLAYWLKVDSSIAITNWGDIIGLECTVGSNSAIIRDEFTNAVGLHQILVGKDTTIGSNTYNYYGAGISTSTAKDVWAHFAIAKNAANTYIYVNGVLTVTLTNSNFESSPQQLTGKIYLGNTSSTAAQFNDLRIYDHCLSAKEVKEIAQGLVLHYKLNGWSGGVGDNILTGTAYNSYDSSLNATTATNSSGKWCGGSGGNGTFSVTEDTTCPIGKFSWNIDNNTSGNRDFQQGNQPYVSEQKYTTSFWAKGSGTCLYRSWNTTDGKAMFTKTWTLTSDWTYYTYTFTASAEMESDLCTFHLGVQGSSSISICGMKMEIGSVATPWTPAPEDLSIDTTKVTDSSGYGNDGLILNVAPQITTETNRYSAASKFPTNTSKIKLPTISYSNFGNSYTISWWEYMTTVSGGPMPWGFSDGNRLNFYHTTNLCWNTGDSGSNPFTPTKTSASLVDNQWHFMAITGDGSATKLYIDGVLHGNSTTYKPLTGTQIYISGWDTGTNYTMINNSMSDFRIYTTTLSAEDVAKLYNNPANVDNLNGIHGFEMVEDIASHELLAIPYTTPYTSNNIFATNYNSNGELYFTDNGSAGSDYIKISPSGKTYYYDMELSIASGNQFYVGFERYDVNKTARSNQACVYIYSTKPTANVTHQRYFGTVNLATDTVNPTDTIRLRILNKWSGSDSGTAGTATVHYLSLREVSTGSLSTGKIKKQGQVYTDEFIERDKQVSIYENGIIGGSKIIEK